MLFLLWLFIVCHIYLLPSTAPGISVLQGILKFPVRSLALGNTILWATFFMHLFLRYRCIFQVMVFLYSHSFPLGTVFAFGFSGFVFFSNKYCPALRYDNSHVFALCLSYTSWSLLPVCGFKVCRLITVPWSEVCSTCRLNFLNAVLLECALQACCYSRWGFCRYVLFLSVWLALSYILLFGLCVRLLAYILLLF